MYFSHYKVTKNDFFIIMIYYYRIGGLMREVNIDFIYSNRKEP